MARLAIKQLFVETKLPQQELSGIHEEMCDLKRFKTVRLNLESLLEGLPLSRRLYLEAAEFYPTECVASCPGGETLAEPAGEINFAGNVVDSVGEASATLREDTALHAAGTKQQSHWNCKPSVATWVRPVPPTWEPLPQEDPMDVSVALPPYTHEPLLSNPDADEASMDDAVAAIQESDFVRLAEILQADTNVRKRVIPLIPF